MKQKMTFLCGFPAAGKTTFAKRFANENPEYVLISADEVRKELYGSQDSYGNPEEIYKELLLKIRTELFNGNSVLYDAVNMKRDYRTDFMNDVFNDLSGMDSRGYYKKIYPSDVEKNIIIIPTDKNVCLERHISRGRDIPIEKIIPYFSIDEPPIPMEGWDNIWTACSMAYVAAPFFDEDDRKNAIEAAKILRSKGIETYLPLEHKVENAWDLPNYKWGEEVFKADIRAINRSDVVVVLSYGRMASAGTSWEAGYAYGIGKRVIIVEMPGVNLMSLMVANGRYSTIKGLKELEKYDFIKMPIVHDLFTEQK